MAEAGQRKKDRWGLFLLIWALVLLLLGVGCCCFLYRYLDVYEKTARSRLSMPIWRRTVPNSL